MEIINLPSGRRAIRKDGELFQEMVETSDLVQKAFAVRKWHQDLGEPSSESLPDVRPVQMISRPKATFIETNDNYVFVDAGDFLARDADGEFFRVAAERVRDHVVLGIAQDAPRGEIAGAAEAAIERAGRVRSAAHSRSESEEASPFLVEENNEGRFCIVSSLPDGRQMTWKKFAWKAAAEGFLTDDKERSALAKKHEAACRSVASVNDLAHALRMQRKADLQR